MKALLAILDVILRALLPVLLERSQPTAEDGQRQAALRDRLRRRVRARWAKAALCMLLALSLAGCGTRTVYVPPGEPVRLRETIKRAKVWVLDADGKPVAGRMDLVEGWYVLPPDDEE